MCTGTYAIYVHIYVYVNVYSLSDKIDGLFLLKAVLVKYTVHVYVAMWYILEYVDLELHQ